MSVDARTPNVRGGLIDSAFTWAANAAIQVSRGNINQPGPGQQAALIAAGYTQEQVPIAMGRTYTVWIDPTGQRVSREQVRPTAERLIRVASNLPVVIPQPVPTPAPPPPFYPPTLPAYQPPPPGSSGSGSSGIPPQPPPAARPTPGINPNAPMPSAGPSMWPFVIAQTAGPSVLDAILRANQYGSAFFDVITGRPRPPAPKGPQGPRRLPRQDDNELSPAEERALERAERARERAEERAERARDRERQIPRSERVATILGSLGGDIWVNPKRLPVPRIPRSAPPPPPPKPLWQQLLPIVGPSLLGLIGRSQGGTRVTLRDPLTQPLTPPVTVPGGLTQPQTLVQSYYSGGGFSGGGSATCECPPKRKKGRKKRRTVCYSGTYSEKATGLRKSKKRKIPCQ